MALLVSTFIIKLLAQNYLLWNPSIQMIFVIYHYKNANFLHKYELCIKHDHVYSMNDRQTPTYSNTHDVKRR